MFFVRGVPGRRAPPTGRGSFPAKPRPPSHQRGRVRSKADDFDVRFRDGRDGRAWGRGADEDDAGNDHGATGGTVDYDLGYDANGWDTQGFRSPAAGYLDDHETAQAGNDVRTLPRRENGRGGTPAPTDASQRVGPLNWAPDAPDAPHAPDAPDARGSTGPWRQVRLERAV